MAQDVVGASTRVSDKMSGAGRDQWILSPEEYADLPSFKGTSLEEELENRNQAADFIQRLGMKLKLYPTQLVFDGNLIVGLRRPLQLEYC